MISSAIGLTVAATATYFGYQRGQGLRCPRHTTEPTWTKPQAILSADGSFAVEIRSWDGPQWDSGSLKDSWLFIDGNPLRVLLGKDKSYQHFCEMVRQLANTTPTPILTPGEGGSWQTVFTYEGALGGSQALWIHPAKHIVAFNAAITTRPSSKL